VRQASGKPITFCRLGNGRSFFERSDNNGDLKLARNQRKVPVATNPITWAASCSTRSSLRERWVQDVGSPRDGVGADALLLALRDCLISDLHFICARMLPKFFRELLHSRTSWLNLPHLFKTQERGLLFK
jgi:hypothetical protein